VTDDDERSAEARALAERALTRLLAGGAPTSELLIVLGGLVPPTLTSDLPDVPAHLGTTDVDVLLVTQLTAGRDLGPIERALEAMDFAPEGDGWRWRGRIDHRVVKIEFLCDLDDQPAEAIVTPAGCTELRAVNLRGTGNVEHDHREITLDGPDGPVRVRIAALAGYLLSKAAAARTRGADKDYYDLAYVLLHNHAGGPAAAAAVINASKLRTALPGMSSIFIELRERFRNDGAVGPRAFAQESLKVTPDADAKLLAADAAAAVNEFCSALRP
jgi:hypothetical protein